MGDNTWNRKCKGENCFGIARGDSNYCSECIKIRKKLGLEIKRSKMEVRNEAIKNYN